jgi:signal transduction histidine kinase
MKTQPPSASLLDRWIGELKLRRIAVVLVLGAFAAVALSPAFVSPFMLLLGRSMFVAVVLLLVFTAVGHWRQTWVPRWLAQVLAVALAAPLATFVVYVLSLGGDIGAVLGHEGRVTGLVSISATALVLGIVTALGALYRERDAQARAEALQFELAKSTLERQALDAHLSLLQAQIEPHFLFNTLANVQALVESGSANAAPVLRHLIAYLRAAMPRLNKVDPTLADELQLSRAYLELMHLRMPDRMQFDVAIDPGLAGLPFPSMALLTLVENAVRHGIDPSEEGGRISIGGQREAASGEVRLWVADTGVGLAETAASGTGLTNLRARLQAFYGADARLDLHEMAPHGVRAEIVFIDPSWRAA